jgi:hypothetical protein
MEPEGQIALCLFGSAVGHNIDIVSPEERDEFNAVWALIIHHGYGLL